MWKVPWGFQGPWCPSKGVPWCPWLINLRWLAYTPPIGTVIYEPEGCWTLREKLVISPGRGWHVMRWTWQMYGSHRMYYVIISFCVWFFFEIFIWWRNRYGDCWVVVRFPIDENFVFFDEYYNTHHELWKYEIIHRF